MISGSEDKTVKVEYVTPYINQLPSFVHANIFERDCKLEEESLKEFHWRSTDTWANFMLTPKILLEVRRDEELKTRAGREERSDVLGRQGHLLLFTSPRFARR